MTRFGQLEETFDLPNLEELTQDSTQDSDVRKSAQALAQSFEDRDHFEIHETEMDEISHLAVEYGKSLHDLGMSVEVKHAGEIFNAAGNMLKIAMDARQLKLEKKLRIMKLEMDQIRLDRGATGPTQEVETGNVRILDRNELLAQLRDIAKSNK